MLCIQKLAWTPFLGALALGACDRDRAGAEELTPSQPPAVDPSLQEGDRQPQGADDSRPAQVQEVSKPVNTAIDRIVLARCELAERCGDVGQGKDYTSRTQCEQKVRSDWRNDLNAYECSRGIDESELSECLQEIRTQDCDNPFDMLGRVTACRSSDICED